MAALIALGGGGKGLVCGSRPCAGRRKAPFVTRLHLCHQQFSIIVGLQACLWRKPDMISCPP
jgi:hypothetical protein